MNLSRPGRSPARSRADRRATATRCSATRCSAISRSGRPCSPASPRTSASASTSRYRGQTHERRRACSSPDRTFRVLGLQPALGRLLGAGRRPERSAGTSSTVLSYAYWQTQLGANPDVLNEHHHRQRAGADDRRRRARRGFNGTTLGHEPKVFVPITMRGADDPGLEGLRQPPELLGVPVRAAEAGRDRSSRRAPR